MLISWFTVYNQNLMVSSKVFRISVTDVLYIMVDIVQNTGIPCSPVIRKRLGNRSFILEEAEP